MAFVTLVGNAGCLPVFPHSPRIEPGLQHGVAYAVQGAEIPRQNSGLIDSTSRKFVPAVQGLLWASYGRRDDEDSGGWRMTATGTLWAAARLDLYWQLPSRTLGGWDVGGGASGQVGAPEALSAYASVGREVGPWWAGYATVARTRMGARDDSTFRHMTSITAGLRRLEGRPVNLFVAATVGPRPAIDCGTVVCRPFTRVVLGMSVDISHYTERDGRVLP